jgi:hypothetical protein
MKMIHLVLILVFISCSGQLDKKSNEKSENITLEQETNGSANGRIAEDLLENGLMSKMKGDWLTAILPDSILNTREILQWRNVFYGDLLISISDNDTLVIRGNMDCGQLKYNVLDKNTIMLPEWNNTKVVYSPEKDLIYLGGESSGRVFKRLFNKELVKTISDERLLMEYVINLLFMGDYLPMDFASKIKYISLGLETYTPFTFDAIGIEIQDGKIEHYGWKFNGDTLNLYATSSTYDDDSGFRSYKLEEFDRQYYKSN